MSTIIMSACWRLRMPPSHKAVLISLSDNANDDGVCWPSIAKISERTCFSERTVQSSIRWLVDHGALSKQERYGRSTVYTVTPASFAPPQMSHPADVAPTPADVAPEPTQMSHLTYADAAPITVKNRNIEPKKEPSVAVAASQPQRAVKPTETELQIACRATWHAYAQAYRTRYGADPVRNQAVNSKIKQFVQRIGFDESPSVAAFFVERVNDAFVVRSFHSVGLMLSSAEAYRTQWATGRTMTQRQAVETDRRQSTGDMARNLADKLRAEGRLS